jgi:hypothetical protein
LSILPPSTPSSEGEEVFTKTCLGIQEKFSK